MLGNRINSEAVDQRVVIKTKYIYQSVLCFKRNFHGSLQASCDCSGML